MTQETLMTHDPATGEPRPYPSHAGQWRAFNGAATAWLFNPWTGERRRAGDVGSDTLGMMILPPAEEMLSVKDHLDVGRAAIKAAIGKAAFMGGADGGPQATDPRVGEGVYFKPAGNPVALRKFMDGAAARPKPEDLHTLFVDACAKALAPKRRRAAPVAKRKAPAKRRR